MGCEDVCAELPSSVELLVADGAVDGRGGSRRGHRLHVAGGRSLLEKYLVLG